MASTEPNDRYLEDIESVLRDALREASQSPHDQLVADTAVRLQNIFMHLRTNAPLTTSASYLRLIRRILSAIRSGMSRNEFLASVFGDIENRSVKNRSIFVIQGFYDRKDDKIHDIEVSNIISYYPNRVREFSNSIKRKQDSSFLRTILVEKLTMDFVLRDRVNDIVDNSIYQNEFEVLDPDNDAWLCCLPLSASEPGEPERVLFAIYSIGENSDSKIPPGAEQEWDILRLVPEIFSILQHRVRHMREKIAEDQRLLIANLAPAAITHEMGTSLALIEGSMDSVTPLLEKIVRDLPDKSMDPFYDIIQILGAIKRQVTHARETAAAFTNLERRAARTAFGLKTMLEDVERVLARRLSLGGITMRYDVPDDLTMETDTRFLGHIVMNVLINAIEAIEPIANAARNDGARSLPQHTIAIEARPECEEVVIVIANDGPEIPISIAVQAFELGVTSKPVGVGHGQGLRLCRQIARHLGGTIRFGRPPAILPDANVSFVLRIPRITQFEGDA